MIRLSIEADVSEDVAQETLNSALEALKRDGFQPRTGEAYDTAGSQLACRGMGVEPIARCMCGAALGLSMSGTGNVTDGGVSELNTEVTSGCGHPVSLEQAREVVRKEDDSRYPGIRLRLVHHDLSPQG